LGENITHPEIGEPDPDLMTPAGKDLDRKTILIFSPDLNLCFSLSILFQDRYHVVTTTNITTFERLATCFGADLAIVDEVPSDCLVRRLEVIGAGQRKIPVIMLYVYNGKDVALDRAIRGRVDSVFYKPVEISLVSKRIDEILTA
jgi:response regulator RpfG family c-di-GMP phosphodiesterase